MATFKRINTDYSIIGVAGTENVNVTAANLAVTGNVTTTGRVIATGNVTTGGQFIGDGSGLFNIPAGNVAATRISFGFSNVDISAANANVTVSVDSTSNVAVFDPTGLVVTGTIEATGGYIGLDASKISNGTSEMTVIASNGNIRGNVAGSTVSLISAGGLDITGDITATANVSGVYFLGTDVLSTGTDITVSAAAGNNSVILAPTGTGTINASSKRISSVATPTTAADAATKEYVDNAVSSGITIHTPVKYESPPSDGSLNATYAQGGTTHEVTDITTGNTLTFSATHSLVANDLIYWSSAFNGISANTAYFVYSVPSATQVTLSTSYNGSQLTGLTNGTGLSETGRANPGVGATLTNAGANAALAIDGVTVSSSDRILIYNQSNAYENGIYTVTTVGDGSTAWVLTRSTDTDTYAPDSVDALDAGDYFYVQAGNTGAGESYVLTAPTGAFIHGYSDLTFTQFSASQVYAAGTGLTLTGTTFSVNASQTQITSVGTLDSLNVTGNVTGGNLNTAGQVVATGNVTGGNIKTSSIVISGTTITGATSVTATGNVTGGNIVTAGLGSFGTTVTATGNITGGNLTTAGIITVNSGGAATAIVNGGSNAVGNIGSSSSYFNRVFATSTSALYADLAEMYLADADYAPGTVVEFGGQAEITIAANGSRAVAGVVSSNPSYIMNSGLDGEHAVAIALQGRVPCRVLGPVRKGNLMISAGNGLARAAANPEIGSVIGKALENFDGDEGVIEVVVGRI